jgi:hypothetical protein
MKARLWLPGVILLGSALAGAMAQEPGQYWIFHQEKIKPAMAQPYEAAAKEFASAVAQDKSTPNFGFEVLENEQSVYMFSTRIDGLGGLDGLSKAFGSVGMGVGIDRWLAMLRRRLVNVDSVQEGIFLEQDDLGYVPAVQRLKPQEMKFFHLDYYYLQPDRETEADNLTRQLAALYASKKVGDAFRVYKLMSGGDMPLLVVRTGARDAADFYAEDAKVRELLGSQGKAVAASRDGVTRRYELHDAVLRSDLSAVPQAAASQAPSKPAGGS